MICPHCKKEIEPQQRRAAASRWAGMTPKERAAEMSRIRKKGIKKRGKKQGVSRRPNVKGQEQPGDQA